MHDNCFSSSFNLGTYYWDKFSFCKKGLCFTDGNIWPSKISNGPKINAEGGQTLPSKFVTWGQH